MPFSGNQLTGVIPSLLPGEQETPQAIATDGQAP